MEPLFEETFLAQDLIEQHPPRLVDRNKQFVSRLACPSKCAHSGRITFARYGASRLPQLISGGSITIHEQRDGVFTYESDLDTNATHWHLNFANTDLFCAYGGRAFAQDELQVAEHPILGALRESLLVSARNQLYTVEQGEPTPIVIMGAERRCEITTRSSTDAGGAIGLYGRRFSSATEADVRKATRLIEPPTRSNILAVEAPANGIGRYSSVEIELILRTAYSGFRAAHIESHRRADGIVPKVVIHTGFWGCGVYGNNRILIALLQCLAARMANVDRLIFHTSDQVGLAAYRRALGILERDLLRQNSLLGRFLHLPPADQELCELLAQIEGMGFEWEKGDGN